MVGARDDDDGDMMITTRMTRRGMTREKTDTDKQ
jgi:hypothetical protein